MEISFDFLARDFGAQSVYKVYIYFCIFYIQHARVRVRPPTHHTHTHTHTHTYTGSQKLFCYRKTLRASHTPLRIKNKTNIYSIDDQMRGVQKGTFVQICDCKN